MPADPKLWRRYWELFEPIERAWWLGEVTGSEFMERMRLIALYAATHDAI